MSWTPAPTGAPLPGEARPPQQEVFISRLANPPPLSQGYLSPSEAAAAVDAALLHSRGFVERAERNDPATLAVLLAGEFFPDDPISRRHFAIAVLCREPRRYEGWNELRYAVRRLPDPRGQVARVFLRRIPFRILAHLSPVETVAAGRVPLLARSVLQAWAEHALARAEADARSHFPDSHQEEARRAYVQLAAYGAPEGQTVANAWHFFPRADEAPARDVFQRIWNLSWIRPDELREFLDEHSERLLRPGLLLPETFERPRRFTFILTRYERHFADYLAQPIVGTYPAEIEHRLQVLGEISTRRPLTAAERTEASVLEAHPSAEKGAYRAALFKHRLRAPLPNLDQQELLAWRVFEGPGQYGARSFVYAATGNLGSSEWALEPALEAFQAMNPEERARKMELLPQFREGMERFAQRVASAKWSIGTRLSGSAFRPAEGPNSLRRIEAKVLDTFPITMAEQGLYIIGLDEGSGVVRKQMERGRYLCALDEAGCDLLKPEELRELKTWRAFPSPQDEARRQALSRVIENEPLPVEDLLSLRSLVKERDATGKPTGILAEEMFKYLTERLKQIDLETVEAPPSLRETDGVLGVIFAARETFPEEGQEEARALFVRVALFEPWSGQEVRLKLQAWYLFPDPAQASLRAAFEKDFFTREGAMPRHPEAN